MQRGPTNTIARASLAPTLDGRRHLAWPLGGELATSAPPDATRFTLAITLPSASGGLRTQRRCDDADLEALADVMALIHWQRTMGRPSQLVKCLAEVRGTPTEPGGIARGLAGMEPPTAADAPSADVAAALLDLGRTSPTLIGGTVLAGDDRHPFALEFPLSSGRRTLTVVPNGDIRRITADGAEDGPEMTVAQCDALICALDLAALGDERTARCLEVADELLRGGPAGPAWNAMLEVYGLERASTAVDARATLLSRTAREIARARGDHRLDDRPDLVDRAAAQWFGCEAWRELAIEPNHASARLDWDAGALTWRGHLILGDARRVGLTSRPYAGTNADTLVGLALLHARELAEQMGDDDALADTVHAAVQAWSREPWRALELADPLLECPHDGIRYAIRVAVFALDVLPRQHG